jgi:hypothetical protein
MVRQQRRAPSDPPPEAAAERAASPVHVVAWGLLLFAGCRAIEIILAAQSMAASVGQAVLVEWAGSRMGIVWSDPTESPTAMRIARRIAFGAAIGLAASGVLVAILLASNAAQVTSVPSFEASVLAIGFITAALTAWRDELLHHGVVLRFCALQATSVSPIGKILACGATSAGAELARTDATFRTTFVAGALGVVFGALWVRDRGAWQPWAAHLAFRYATGTLAAGGVLQMKLLDNSWAGGTGGMLGGTAAAIAFAPLAIAAIVWTGRASLQQKS